MRHVAGSMWQNATVGRLNSDEVGWLLGTSPSDLPGWKRIRSPAPVAVSPSRRAPLVDKTDLELLAAGLSPLRIARAAALRIARRAQREADRAKMAQQLLEAARVAQPGKRFSMADAGLARAAAGVEQCDIPDKRRLRGEAREAARAEKATRVALPMSTLGKTRGNGVRKRGTK